ncbi:ethanolamine utilization protein EutJ [Endozoicomonas elysicola]|uniref:Ethanolamine utilization protein EutJ n=1 Tax=Endozoicomonas elysicola TaxID=305900 RepID=A0A081K5L3_9GAMM|nr:ethanolamine utilization protein EutJ [Endozoicomonas elysicola]KEI69439.1 ethanolamine utilization protein EutJ [Endozoicomonas elysicola]
MSEFNPERVSKLIQKVENSLTHTAQVTDADKLVVGVDLGTAYIVLVVLDHHGEPVATEMQFAQVLKDGLVVDYIGALNIVRQLKEKLETRLQVSLEKAAIAMPSNTPESVCKTHRYVVEGAGMEVVNMLDEPTAANRVLGIRNGAVVDIGGGTTGLSIFKDGEVIYTADEATGGTHLSLVLAGHYKTSFEEAEEQKKDSANHRDVVAIVRPVIEKMGSIVHQHIQGFDVKDIYLVGGTTCLPEFEQIVEKQTGVTTWKPENPFLVTPLGIAISALEAENLLES